MKEKIAEIILPHITQDDFDTGDCQNDALGIADQILALFKQCPVSDIEDCPWGKENVEFRKILLKSLPSLDGILVEEECQDCSGKGKRSMYNDMLDKWEEEMCFKCAGTGTITRQAEWGEFMEWAKSILKTTERSETCKFCGTLKSGGRLRIREN